MSLFSPGGTVNVYVNGDPMLHHTSEQKILYEVDLPLDDSTLVVEMDQVSANKHQKFQYSQRNVEVILVF